MKYLMKLENFTESKIYLKTFEQNNKEFKIGDRVVYFVKTNFPKNFKFGDVCKITAIKYYKGIPFIKAKVIETNKLARISSYWINSRYFMLELDFDALKYNL